MSSAEYLASVRERIEEGFAEDQGPERGGTQPENRRERMFDGTSQELEPQGFS